MGEIVNTKMMRLRSAIIGTALLAGVIAPIATAPSASAATALVSIGDASGVEGDVGNGRGITFSITLDAPAGLDVRVDWMVQVGSAGILDIKNFGGAVRTATIRAGKVSAFANVTILPDAVVGEGDETFEVHLLGTTTNASIEDHLGVGTVIDDDAGAGVILGAGGGTVHEGNSGARQLKMWVTLSEPAVAPVTVSAMLMGSGAGADYKAYAKTITFLSGQFKKPVVVTIYAEAMDEEDEVFHLMLEGATPGVTVLNSEVPSTIIDDDIAANLTTQSFLIGPFTLNPFGTAGADLPGSSNAPRPAGVVGIKNMRFALVDSNGDSVSHHTVHMHHNLMVDWGRTDNVCGGPARFAGAGKELNSVALPDGYAYKTHPTQIWSSIWHLMNKSAETRTVYMKYTIDYLTGADLAAARDVQTYWYDVTGCAGGSEFDVPGNGGAGSYYTRSTTVTHARAGTRVYQGGHMHDGGVDIVTKRQSNNAVICTNIAAYDSMGMLDSITACPAVSSIAAGEQFSYTTRYMNDTAWPGAMGLGTSYVYEP